MVDTKDLQIADTLIYTLQMARMFTNSIYYVHEKSAMAALSENIPIIHPKGND